jgi:TolB-like protein
VVLPFVNLGGDPEQEYFVDGVTESLTTDLSRISGSLAVDLGEQNLKNIAEPIRAYSLEVGS